MEWEYSQRANSLQNKNKDHNRNIEFWSRPASSKSHSTKYGKKEHLKSRDGSYSAPGALEAINIRNRTITVTLIRIKREVSRKSFIQQARAFTACVCKRLHLSTEMRRPIRAALFPWASFWSLTLATAQSIEEKHAQKSNIGGHLPKEELFNQYKVWRWREYSDGPQSCSLVTIIPTEDGGEKDYIHAPQEIPFDQKKQGARIGGKLKSICLRARSLLSDNHYSSELHD